MSAKDSENDWWQVIIEDEDSLSGDSVAKTLSIIFNHLQPILVVLDDIEGAGIGVLRKRSDVAGIEPSQLLEMLKAVVQLDWCDFYLVDNDVAIKTMFKKPYWEIISSTIATVRAVDDTYFYIYTKDYSLVQILLKEHPDAEIKKDDIKNLDYPF